MASPQVAPLLFTFTFPRGKVLPDLPKRHIRAFDTIQKHLADNNTLKDAIGRTIAGTVGVMTCMYGSSYFQPLPVGYILQLVQYSSALMELGSGCVSPKAWFVLLR